MDKIYVLGGIAVLAVFSIIAALFLSGFPFSLGYNGFPLLPAAIYNGTYSGSNGLNLLAYSTSTYINNWTIQANAQGTLVAQTQWGPNPLNYIEISPAVKISVLSSYNATAYAAALAQDKAAYATATGYLASANSCVPPSTPPNGCSPYISNAQFLISVVNATMTYNTHVRTLAAQQPVTSSSTTSSSTTSTTTAGTTSSTTIAGSAPQLLPRSCGPLCQLTNFFNGIGQWLSQALNSRVSLGH